MNEEQATLWNGVAGRTWVDARELLEHVLEPMVDLLVEADLSRAARRVLDVGFDTIPRARGSSRPCAPPSTRT